MLGQILLYEGIEDMAVGVRPDTRVAIGNKEWKENHYRTKNPVWHQVENIPDRNQYPER